jgi:hypothetical protein
VARLLALVADTVLGFGAVTAQVADVTTIVALLALSAVTGKVAETSAGVAGLTRRSVARAAVATSLSTVASNVTNLSAYKRY